MANSLIKNSIIYGSGAVLTKAIGFFLIPVYTRFFTVEEYGMLSLLNVMLTLVSFVFLLGVSSAAMRFYFDPDANGAYRRELYGNASFLLITFPLLLFFIISPFAYILVNHLLTAIPFFPYVLIILLVGLFSPIEALMLGLLRVKEKARTFVIYNFSFFVGQTVMIIIAVVLFKHGLKGLLYAQFLANIIFWIIALTILKRNSELSFSWEISKSLLVYGVPLMPFFFFTWIYSASGRFLLERYTSLKEVGIFALAAQFSGILGLISAAFDNVFMPYFYKTAQKNDAPEILGQFATKYVAVFSLIMLFILATAKYVVLIMADPKFYGSIDYISLLLLAGLLSVVFRFFHWNLMFNKRTGIISLMTGVSAAAIVALLYLSLKYLHMGIKGVIYAMIIVEMGRIIAGYFISQKYFRINFRMADVCLVLFVILTSAYCNNLITVDTVFDLKVVLKLMIFTLTFILVLKISKIEWLKDYLFVKS